MDVLRSMRDLADEMRQALAGEGDLDRFAALLHEGWELKRSLGFGISNDQVNEWYEAARRAGATGGKLLGAGGGGFLLLMAPPWRHRAIREALGRPRELPFRIARHGSRNIFIQQLDRGPDRETDADASGVTEDRVKADSLLWRAGWEPGSAR